MLVDVPVVCRAEQDEVLDLVLPALRSAQPMMHGQTPAVTAHEAGLAAPSGPRVDRGSYRRRDVVAGRTG